MNIYLVVEDDREKMMLVEIVMEVIQNEAMVLNEVMMILNEVMMI
jgi:hypothetical protein